MERILQRHFTEDQRWLQPTSVTSPFFASLNHALSLTVTSYVAVPSLFTYKIMEHHHAEGPFMWHTLNEMLESTSIHAKKTIEAIYHLYPNDDYDKEKMD